MHENIFRLYDKVFSIPLLKLRVTPAQISRRLNVCAGNRDVQKELSPAKNMSWQTNVVSRASRRLVLTFDPLEIRTGVTLDFCVGTPTCVSGARFDYSKRHSELERDEDRFSA